MKAVQSFAEDQEAIVQALLAAGTSVDIGCGATQVQSRSSGATALHYALETYGSEATLQQLLEADADVDKAVLDGSTPLMMAAQEGHVAVVRLLQQAATADVRLTTDDLTMLDIVAHHGCREPAAW